MSSRSVILGLSVVTVTYILVNIAFLLVLTPEEVKSSEVEKLKTEKFQNLEKLSRCSFSHLLLRSPRCPLLPPSPSSSSFLSLDPFLATDSSEGDLPLLLLVKATFQGGATNWI